MVLSITEAKIISTTLGGMLYGLSIPMYILTFWILSGPGNARTKRTSYAIMAAGVILAIGSTAQFAVNTARIILGVVVYGPQLKGGADAFLGDVTEPSFIVKSALENLQTLVFDAVVIYRCWKVWNRWWVPAVPALGWAVLLALSIGTNHALFYAQHTGNIFATSTGRWITGVYVTTLIVNLSATGLLALRIYLVHRKSVQYLSDSSLKVTMRIVLESGAIYSIMITCGMITFILRSRGVFIIFDMLCPTTSIAFNLIIVRIGFISDERLIAKFPNLQQGGEIPPSTIRFGRHSEMRTETHRTGLESKSLAIELTRFSDADDVSATDKAGTNSEIGAGTEALSAPHLNS
ncbi:hypothetical protein BXZ70DRAFT_892015 [Cristinia sonorae]|uniref:Uncharacterized protein n=1 Tax=Cristinia sonorae TaxID=1940300 RepID=A0A8K0UQQ8_9AGAR|nr:hypothetical protein BXZ70DRAFT_892015 [Cristinia sonorae]